VIFYLYYLVLCSWIKIWMNNYNNRVLVKQGFYDSQTLMFCLILGSMFLHPDFPNDTALQRKSEDIIRLYMGRFRIQDHPLLFIFSKVMSSNNLGYIHCFYLQQGNVQYWFRIKNIPCFIFRKVMFSYDSEWKMIYFFSFSVK